MTLTNYTEKMVYERLREYIDLHQDEFCTCSQCVEDIMALALNHLPPKYVASSKGEAITEYRFAEPLDRTKVLTEVVRAIRTVQRAPSHASG